MKERVGKKKGKHIGLTDRFTTWIKGIFKKRTKVGFKHLDRVREKIRGGGGK